MANWLILSGVLLSIIIVTYLVKMLWYILLPKPKIYMKVITKCKKCGGNHKMGPWCRNLYYKHKSLGPYKTVWYEDRYKEIKD